MNAVTQLMLESQAPANRNRTVFFPAKLYKLYKPYVKLDARKFFFSVRVVDVWNSLSEELPNSLDYQGYLELLQCRRTVQTFKRHFDLCLYNRGSIYLSFLELLSPFLPLHAYSNGAVMPSLNWRPSVRPSVRLSVTLVDCDHIRWARWNFITRLISPMSSLAARKISAI